MLPVIRRSRNRSLIDVMIVFGAALLATLALGTLLWFRVNSALDAVQSSRLAACRENNHRHDRTEALLAGDFARQRTPQSQREATLRLIDALSPKNNCKLLITLQPKD